MSMHTPIHYAMATATAHTTFPHPKVRMTAMASRRAIAKMVVMRGTLRRTSVTHAASFRHVASVKIREQITKCRLLVVSDQ